MTEAPTFQEILPSGSTMKVEIYKNPNGIVGTVAHWGEELSTDKARSIISERHDIPVEKLPTHESTGFTTIWHQQDGLDRLSAIRDEEYVARSVVDTAIQESGWDPQDVDALYLGSGVPITDKASYDPENPVNNYAARVAELSGLRPDVALSNTHAACNSGNFELLNALNNPELQGKKVIVVGVEGITHLTENFDPTNADYFSSLVFSNGAAALAIQPDGPEGYGNIAVHDSSTKVIKEHTFLVGEMTYEHLLNLDDPEIWQSLNGVNMIKGGTPPDNKRLYMNTIKTALFFGREVPPFIYDIIEKNRNKIDISRILKIIGHKPSKGVNEILGRKLKNIPISMPWEHSDDGNSSGATSTIVFARSLMSLKNQEPFVSAAYGAGASFSAGILELKDN